MCPPNHKIIFYLGGMRFNWAVFTCILMYLVVYQAGAQSCPIPAYPVDGDTNVPIDSPLTWTSAPGVTGYIISIGTTPGGGEIISNQNIGNTNSYSPPLGLPDDTVIYVSLTLFFFNLPDIPCEMYSFRTEDVITPPSCTVLSRPTDGATDVPVASNISWTYARGATGYRITVGTAPGLGDIIDNLDVGNTLGYNLPADLPDSTLIYVRIVPYNENGAAVSCVEESFTTGSLGTLPVCSNIIYPQDGEINVPISPLIQWEEVTGATGYIVTIGTTPTANDVLNAGTFSTNSTYVINFSPNTIYFIRIVPFNAVGQAIGCIQTSFSTILGCGPFYSEETGELTQLNPELSLPETIGICLDGNPFLLEAPDEADGYRLYRVLSNDDWLLISEERFVYEAYNLSDPDQDLIIECPSNSTFEVVASEAPVITNVDLTERTGGLDITVTVVGLGNYEYALDNANGPYQDSPVFINAPEDTSTIYVRDKNGCGVVSYAIATFNFSQGFPPFFTPNGDGYHDYWQYVPQAGDEFQLSVIHIFDRYGNRLTSIRPDSRGWDGLVNGARLPTAGYWYHAVTTEGESYRGYFTLKR